MFNFAYLAFNYYYMKVLKPYFPLTFCLIFLLMIAQSCKQTEFGSWKNEAINSEKRTEFHKLNDDLYAALKSNDMKQMEPLMSKELLEDNPPVNRTVELISLRSKDLGYKVLDEYYLSQKDEPGSLIINSNATGPDAYTLKYNQSATKENYIAFLMPERGNDKWLITAIYGKYNYGWKLNKLDFAQYTVNDKTAPELFKQAKADYAKGYIINAVNNMSSAQQTFHPSGQWVYGNESAMNKFYFKVVQEVNTKYTFPFTLKQVPTKPQIFRIFTQVMPEGTFPTIYYLSSVPLSNVAALKKENEHVKKIIGKALPGINEDKKYVLYAAFNALPDGKKATPHYDFSDQLK